MAASWDDPKLLHLGPLPKFANGEGSTVFWTTGCALFKYGQNKEKAAEYIKALTYDPQIWKDSIVGTPGVHPGQLPPYKSIYAGLGLEASPTGCRRSSASCAASSIAPRRSTTTFSGCSNSSSASRSGRAYLKGEEPDPKVAMQKVMDAVQAEIKKG